MIKFAPSFHQFATILESNHDISLSLKIQLKAMLKFTTASKGTILLKQGQKQSGIWFMNKGMAKATWFTNDLLEPNQIMWCWYKGDLVFNQAFFYQQPSEISIELIEDSELAFLPFDQLKLLMEIVPEAATLFEKIRFKYQRAYDYHLNQKHLLNAKERYLILIKLRPELFDIAKQKDIANFLGINANTLSRLKRLNR